MNQPYGSRPPPAASASAPPAGVDSQTIDHGGFVVRRRPQLQWVDAAGPHELTIEVPTLIGSASGAGIVLEDRTVSRMHAEIEPREDGLWVRDLGSRNGTFIEEVRIDSGCVPPGGKLRLGAAVLIASYNSAPAPVEMWSSERFGPLVGRCRQMRELFARLARIARTDSSVLIHGETGTGKEVVARAIHEASARAKQPFVIVDCAALPENLLEAELFGHTKGAFTGAVTSRPGAIEAADGGTVFLDEIGELPLSVQPKLLRVLESRQVRRLGETTHRQVNVRFLSATHRNLQQMVNANAFREDLYFRLAVLVVAIPPLRERAEDIPALVDHLLGGHLELLDPVQLREIASRPWLGNVRELRNFLERARALGAHEALAMTPARPGAANQPVGDGSAEWRSVQISFDRPYKDVREDWIEYLEREYYRRVLERANRNVPAAAEAAGVDRTYIYRMIRRYDL